MLEFILKLSMIMIRKKPQSVTLSLLFDLLAIYG